MRGALGVIKTKSCQAGYTLRKLDVQLVVPTALVQNLYQFFSTHLSNNSSNVDAFPRFFLVLTIAYDDILSIKTL